MLCDGCGDLAEPDDRGGAPAGRWLLAELSGLGGDWTQTTEFHACCAECALQVLHQIAEARDEDDAETASALDRLKDLRGRRPVDRSLVDELLAERRIAAAQE